MRRYTAIYVALILTVCIAGFRPVPGISGKWKGTIQGSQGDIALVFTFKVNGDSLSGTVQSPMGNAIPISNGKVNGDSFSFDVSFGGNTIHHDCTLEGDTVSMKIEGIQNGDMTLKLARVKDDQ